MKKIITLALVLTMLFSLCACNLFDLAQYDDTIEFDAEKVSQNFEALTDSGFMIKLNVTGTSSEDGTETTQLIYGQSKDRLYFKNEEQEVVIDLSASDRGVIYTKNEEGQWIKETTIYEESGITKEDLEFQMESYTSTFMAYMSQHGMFVDSPVKKTETTLLGRKCDKYEFEIGAFGMAIKYSFVVDQATGFCLESDFGASAGVGESAAVKFKCVEFDTSYTVEVPTNAIEKTEEPAE